MPGTPVILAPGISGLSLSGSDYNNNLALMEQSFLDTGPWIISGLVPAPGAGLAVQVSAGIAVIGAHLALAAFAIAPLAPNTTNWLWLQQNGHGLPTQSATPPPNSVLLGTAATGANSVNSVNTGASSGRQQFQQPQNLIPGGPAAGLTSAGHLASINLANWAASAAEGVAIYGVLPAGAGGGGMGAKPLVTITANYGVTSADHYVNANAAAGGFNVNLPTAVGRSGVDFQIKKIDATANAVLIQTVSAQTIDSAAAPYSMTTPNQALQIVSDGANWFLY